MFKMYLYSLIHYCGFLQSGKLQTKQTCKRVVSGQPRDVWVRTRPKLQPSWRSWSGLDQFLHLSCLKTSHPTASTTKVQSSFHSTTILFQSSFVKVLLANLLQIAQQLPFSFIEERFESDSKAQLCWSAIGPSENFSYLQTETLELSHSDM